jgi:hypothetical protein
MMRSFQGIRESAEAVLAVLARPDPWGGIDVILAIAEHEAMEEAGNTFSVEGYVLTVVAATFSGFFFVGNSVVVTRFRCRFPSYSCAASWMPSTCYSYPPRVGQFPAMLQR